MTETTTQNDQVTEQQVEGGEAEGAEINKGPFEQQADAEAAFKDAKATGKPYKLWTVQVPGKPARFTVAIDSGRALLVAARADGYQATRVGGGKKMVSAADIDGFLASMTDEQRAEYLARYLPKGKGGKAKGKAEQQQ